MCCAGAFYNGPERYYRRARLRSNNTLADAWFPADLLPAFSLGLTSLRVYCYDDHTCYLIDSGDAPSATPGAVMQTWQVILIAGMDAACGCGP